MHSSLIGEERTLELLRRAGLEAATVERRRGPLGPLMAERVRQGALPPDVTEEEVLIIRGQLASAKSEESVREGLHGVPSSA